MEKAIILSLALFVLVACDKNKKLSKRLSGETWKVSTFTVGGAAKQDLAEINFDDCNIYDENCTATWMLEGQSANFIWQFREKGKVFEISNQSSLSTDIEPAILQCMNLSGIYDVTDNGKTSMTISSNATFGYEGQSVEIKLAKQ